MFLIAFLLQDLRLKMDPFDLLLNEFYILVFFYFFQKEKKVKI